MGQVSFVSMAGGIRQGISRRGFGLTCLAGAGCLAMPRLGVAGAPPADRHFAIYRDGKEIGHHVVRFTPTDGGFKAETAIEVAVKIAFITAFRFKQNAADVWTDGQLVGSRVDTDDNGEVSQTVLRSEGGKLNVEGGVADRQLSVPLGTMTDLAFWNIDIVRQRTLVDLQKALLTDVAAENLGAETIDVAGRRIEAQKFKFAAETGRNGDIWFDADGNWVKGLLTTRGETLDYRLLA